MAKARWNPPRERLPQNNDHVLKITTRLCAVIFHGKQSGSILYAMESNQEAKMDIQTILRHVDLTILDQTATWDQIQKTCDLGIAYQTAQVCVPPSYLKQAKAYVGDRLKIGTAVGYPNGYNTTAVKVMEAREAVENGADELDMVINIAWAKEGNFQQITQEIRAVRAVCPGLVLKVIIEACFLTDAEKIQLCKCVHEAGADYIKTSSGFAASGATYADVSLLCNHAAPGLKVKAAGGISTLEQAQRFLELGADRLGSSKLVANICTEQT